MLWRVLARKRGCPARYGTGILPVFSICPGARRPSYSRRDDRAPSQLGQAEIENLRLPTLGHEDIRRLNVAVDDAFGVRRVEPIRYLNGEIQQRVDPQGTALGRETRNLKFEIRTRPEFRFSNFDFRVFQQLPQRLPFQKLHGNEGLPFEFAADRPPTEQA